MEVSNFGRNIKALRDREKISQYALAEVLGTTQTTIGNWETRGLKPRSKETIKAICDKYNVTETDLFGFSDGLYAKLHGLSNAPKGAIAPVASPVATLPLRGRIHAGEPTGPEELDGIVELPAGVAASHPNAYFLEVEGDCMDKVYPEGCYILIDPDREPQDGSIAAVSIDGGDYVMRRLKRGAGMIMLSPESFNAEHRSIVVSDDDGKVVSYAGTVVWFQPKKEMR